MATRARKDEELERPEDARETEGESAAGPLAALAEGLDEIVPGLEVLDREIVFEGGARADLAAVDPSGRLHLVLLAGADAERAALEALDALAILRSQLEVLVRHFGATELNPERAPRLLVVCPGADERLVRRLALLADAGLIVLGMRSVKSAAGERTYLVRLEPGGAAAGPTGGVAAFLRALPARLEPLGLALVERMERLDEELTPAADGTTIVWRIGGEVLCRVERVGDLLQASVAPRHDALPLGDTADLERLVEAALARLVRVLGLTRAERPAPGPRPAPRADEPILTPEEIQAFRE